jgi:hypothetical protein
MPHMPKVHCADCQHARAISLSLLAEALDAERRVDTERQPREASMQALGGATNRPAIADGAFGSFYGLKSLTADFSVNGRYLISQAINAPPHSLPRGGFVVSWAKSGSRSF